MSSLLVLFTTDFSGETMAGVSAIGFANPSPAEARFSASQFDGIQILSDVTITGNSSANAIRVRGTFIDATDWRFDSWSITDKVILNGASGADTLIGSATSDLISGANGNDTLRGGAGNDVISGDAGTNALAGGSGDDQLISAADASADTLVGGAGTDLARLDRSSSTGSLNIDISAGGGLLDIGDGTRLASIERIVLNSGSANCTARGGSLTDQLTGGSGDDRLNGMGGGDSLSGGGGHNVLCGRSGDDSIGSSPFAQADTINGGGGSDALGLDRQFSALDLNVDIRRGGEGKDIGDGTAIASIERLDAWFGSGDDRAIGGSAADFLSGADGNDQFRVGAGRDTLTGGAGDDTLFGGADEDDLHGGNDIDVLAGGAGDDVIDGGDGADMLTGGAGADHFVFVSISDSPASGPWDFIADFDATSLAGHDICDLHAIDAKVGGNDVRFRFIGTGDFSGTPGELRLKYLANSTLVEADVTGDGTADFAVECGGLVPLQSMHFLL